MSDHDLFTIGELARRTGLSVRTIRFWSDAEVIPPTRRSGTGYRLYDTEAVARLDLVRTLRELGVDLETVRKVLRDQTTVAEVAKVHADALDTEIRTLRVRRAVLRSVARRHSSSEEMTIMHKMATLSAAERQRMIDEFVDRTFAGIDEDAPGAGIAKGMRMIPSTLPDDPTPEQLDAWIELAELVEDPRFRQRCRDMAVNGAQAQAEQPFDQERAERVTARAQQALRDGVAPDSDAAGEIVAELSAMFDGVDHTELADRLAGFTDARVERYWTLLGILNGWPAREPQVPAWEWLIAALRAGS